eukprot:963706-Rhodomonas_salina.6
MSDFAGGAGQTWDSVVQNWEVLPLKAFSTELMSLNFSLMLVFDLEAMLGSQTSELLTSFAVVVADAWSFAYNPKEPPALIWATKKIPVSMIKGHRDCCPGEALVL